MPTRVRFVVNTLSGEVEEFVIDDQDRSLPDAEHDLIAREIGELIARNPAITPMPPSAPARREHATPERDPEREEERARAGDSTVD